MTRQPTRRTVLGGCVTVPFAVAGCLGTDRSGPAATTPGAWPTEQWRRELPSSGPESLIATPSAGRIYVRVDGGVTAYDATGTQRWHRTVPGDLRVATAGALLVAVDGDLRALDGDSGETRWVCSFHPETTVPAAAVHDGEVYVVASRVRGASDTFEGEYARLYRVDPAAGDETQLLDLPGPADDTWRATGAGGGVTLARDDGLVVSYDAAGTERWRADLRTGDEEPPSATERETADEPASDHQREYATGEGLWIRFGGVVDGTLLVGVRGGIETVHALAADSGEVQWETRGYGVVESVGPRRALLTGGDTATGARVASVDPVTGDHHWTRTIERGILDERYGVTTGDVHYEGLLLDDGGQAVLALDATSGETVAEGTVDGPLVGPVSLDDRLVFGTRGEAGGVLWASAPVVTSD